MKMSLHHCSQDISQLFMARNAIMTSLVHPVVEVLKQNDLLTRERERADQCVYI